MHTFLDVLIGIMTYMIVFLLFKKIEKDRMPNTETTKYIFFLIVVFCSYIYKPSQSIDSVLLWAGISLLLYSVLDDMLTKTIDIKIPIIVTLVFYIIIRNPYDLFISFSFFAILLLFSLVTKEKVMAQGDAYILLPLTLLAGSSLFLASFYLSLILGVVVLAVVDVVKKESEYAFIPFFVIGTMIVVSDFFATELALLFTFLLFLSIPVIYITSRKND